MKEWIICLSAVTLLAACNQKQSQPQDTDQQPAEELTMVDTNSVADEGEMAPDFTLIDSEGNPLTLSSLRGQYVVLDFWGTWCKWCVKGIPDMKAYYQKYEGMFELLSIDFGDDEDTWLKAIESYGMEWRHVITDEQTAEQLQIAYNIEGFPTKLVIDPDGRILKVIVGEDPAFYTYLDDLLGQK